MQKIEEKRTQNGKYGLSATLVIRNDVEQKCQNRAIFYTMWKRKNPTPADEEVGGYGFSQVMQFARAVGLPEGKDYNGIDALCADISGKILSVKIGHREYGGKIYEDIKFMDVTKFPDCKHKFKEKNAETFVEKTTENFVNTNDYEDILSDDDLPF